MAAGTLNQSLMLWNSIGLSRSLQQGGGVLNQVPYVMEAATQTFKIGAPLVNSAGYLAEAGTNPTTVIGIATAAGHNDASAGLHAIEYIPAVGDNILFSIQTDSVGLAQSVLFATYGLTKDGTTGFWYLDSTKSGANQIVRVMGFIDPPTTVNGKVIVRWLRASSTIYV